MTENPEDQVKGDDEGWNVEFDVTLQSDKLSTSQRSQEDTDGAIRMSDALANLRVLHEVDQEVQSQRARYGDTYDDENLTPWHWVSVIGYYSTQWLVRAWEPLEKSVVDQFREAMVKVAALAVSAILSVDRQRRAVGACRFEKGYQPPVEREAFHTVEEVREAWGDNLPDSPEKARPWGLTPLYDRAGDLVGFLQEPPDSPEAA